MIVYGDGTRIQNGPEIVRAPAELIGDHHGGISVEDGGHLLISGHLLGGLLVFEGGHVTITGVVQGAVLVQGGTCFAEQPSLIQGATVGVISFGRQNGAAS